ncbi:MAG: 30S ribosomal protein S6, partial [Pseudomonadota bacterium]
KVDAHEEGPSAVVIAKNSRDERGRGDRGPRRDRDDRPPRRDRDDRPPRDDRPREDRAPRGDA